MNTVIEESTTKEGAAQGRGGQEEPEPVKVSYRDPNRPMHRRKDIEIGPGGKQIWKKIN